jgi:GABA(A) receptor-associated protein
MPPTDSLFLLVDGKKVIQQSLTVGELYDKYKKEDGFLYIVYTSEVVSG